MKLLSAVGPRGAIEDADGSQHPYVAMEPVATCDGVIARVGVRPAGGAKFAVMAADGGAGQGYVHPRVPGGGNGHEQPMNEGGSSAWEHVSAG